MKRLPGLLFLRIPVCFLLFLVTSHQLAADNQQPLPMETYQYNLSCGPYDGHGVEFIGCDDSVTIPQAKWIQVSFFSVNLNGGSYVKLISGQDTTQKQILDSAAMIYWKRSSALFSGNKVIIEFHVGPSAVNTTMEVNTVNYILAGVAAPLCESGTNCPSWPADDRTASSDPRVARVVMIFSDSTADGITRKCMFASAFLVRFGRFVGAEHYFKSYPGMQLYQHIVQFNPPSSDNRVPMPPAPQDQYPIDYATVQTSFTSDWAVFDVYNRDPVKIHDRPFFDIDFSGDFTPRSIEMRGYGCDDEAGKNHAQQTSSGQIIAYWPETYTIYAKLNGRSGNSGSPYVDPVTDSVIGVESGYFCKTDTLFAISFLEPEFREAVSRRELAVDQGILVHRVGSVPLEDEWQSVGKVRRLQNQYFWDTLHVMPTTVATHYGAWETFQADTSIYEGGKFHNWNGVPLNPQKFEITELLPGVRATFDERYEDVTIKSVIAGREDISGGRIYFKDPWYPDSFRSEWNFFENRGVNAVFRLRNSPFNLGSEGYRDEYKGVFLKQEPVLDNPTIPYYSIRAESTQVIGGFTVQFDHWEATGAQVVPVGANPPGYDQKAVVFTAENGAITVKAVYKAKVTSTLLAPWSMASIPVIVNDFRATQLYPNKLGAVFHFTTTGGYQARDTLNAGKGYWVKHDAPPTITYAGAPFGCDTIAVEAGWNQIGSVSIAFPANEVKTLGTTLGSQFFRYAASGDNNGYLVSDTLKPGLGYWVKSDSVGSLILNGSGTQNKFITSNTPPPRPDAPPAAPTLVSPENYATNMSRTPTLVWTAETYPDSFKIEYSLFSTMSNPVVQRVSGYYGGVTVGPLAYSTSYWWQVSAKNQNGWGTPSSRWKFTVQAEPSGGGDPGGGGCTQSASIPTMDNLTITDATGAGQTLYFRNGAVALDPGLLEDAEMPPALPGNVLDVRFASGKYREDIPATRTRGQYPIELTNAVYPITLSWDVKDGNRASYWLKTPGSDNANEAAFMALANRGNKAFGQSHGNLIIEAQAADPCDPTSTRPIRRDDPVEQAAKPASYAMHQNLPNPFNPTTLINYELPEDARVVLKVYNMLGQEVATLVDEDQSAGYKVAQFDAQSLSTGVYIYRLSAGAFNDVKKMLLVR